MKKQKNGEYIHTIKFLTKEEKKCKYILAEPTWIPSDA